MKRKLESNYKAYASMIPFAFLLVLVLAGVRECKSQEKFGTMRSILMNGERDIEISSNKNEFSLWFHGKAVEGGDDEIGGFRIKQKQYNSFIESVKASSDKYKEWLATAQTNNVDDFSKAMNITTPAEGFFKFGRDWQFQFSIRLQFQFIVVKLRDSVVYSLVIKTGKMKSSSNQFIDTDGYFIAFSSADEIDQFLDSIQIDKINAFINSPKKDDLFKN